MLLMGRVGHKAMYSPAPNATAWETPSPSEVGVGFATGAPIATRGPTEICASARGAAAVRAKAVAAARSDERCFIVGKYPLRASLARDQMGDDTRVARCANAVKTNAADVPGVEQVRSAVLRGRVRDPLGRRRPCDDRAARPRHRAQPRRQGGQPPVVRRLGESCSCTRSERRRCLPRLREAKSFAEGDAGEASDAKHRRGRAAPHETKTPRRPVTVRHEP